jgi:hypothetical protein
MCHKCITITLLTVNLLTCLLKTILFIVYASFLHISVVILILYCKSYLMQHEAVILIYNATFF